MALGGDGLNVLEQDSNVTDGLQALFAVLAQAAFYRLTQCEGRGAWCVAAQSSQDCFSRPPRVFHRYYLRRKEKMSARRSAAFPMACSGLM